MCKRNDIDFARFDARKLTPEQWERLQRGLLLRAHAARAQALRDLPGGVVRWLRAVASGGRDVVRLLAERAAATAAVAGTPTSIRRERRAAIRELGALDDRSLKDLGLHRSEIEIGGLQFADASDAARIFRPASASVRDQIGAARRAREQAIGRPAVARQERRLD